MSKVQEIFDRVQKTKNEQKKIKAAYRDALANSQSFQKAQEELKAAREKKKKIEQNIQEDFAKELEQLEVLKTDLENDMMLLSDAALTQITKGNPVEVKDTRENKYEPIFSVRFKKVR